MTSDSLLLAPDTRVTCPNCEQEFSLEQGFAKQALEAVAASSTSSLAALRDQAAERRAQQTAGEQAKAAQRQVEDLQRMLKEQGDAHTRALAGMRALTEQAFKPQLDAMKEQLATSQLKLSRNSRKTCAAVPPKSEFW
jgi:uncharacterized Zn finger protein (UPF0148 family)